MKSCSHEGQAARSKKKRELQMRREAALKQEAAELGISVQELERRRSLEAAQFSAGAPTIVKVDPPLDAVTVRRAGAVPGFALLGNYR